MPLLELLTDAKGNVIGVRRSEQSTPRELLTTGLNAYSFGQTQGASLEKIRFTYADVVRQSTVLTKDQQDEIIRQVLMTTVSDRIILREAKAGEVGVLLKPVAVGGDEPKQLPPLIKVFVDP